MKTQFINYLLILFLAISLKCSYGQNVFEPYHSKEKLQADVKKIIDDFDQFMKDRGVNPPYVPGVSVQTAPFLIKWDEPNKGIILPYWDELMDEQKELFKTWRGYDAEEFFISLFNWFFVPHELGHFMVFSFYPGTLSPYQSELAANEFAIEFLTSDAQNRGRINYVKESLNEVLKVIPSIDFGEMSEEEYFNTYYQQLGNNPNAYGYFQFKFILDILNNREKIDILKYLH